MGSSTNIFSLPYPTGTDRVMDGDNAIQALADRLELLLTPVIGAPSGFRNVIRNGDMGVTQRGTGIVSGVTAGAYGADGWLTWALGAAANSSVGNLGAAQAPWKRYIAASLTTPAAAAPDYAFLSQRIEDVRTMAGYTVTLSFQGASTVAGRALGIGLVQSFGTGGAPSPTVTTAVSAVVIPNSTLTRYTVTFVVPSILGRTIGSNEDSYLELRLFLGVGSNLQPQSGLSLAQGLQGAWTLNITGVQLELGAAATPFERLPHQQQLAWCQRYYWRWTCSTETERITVGLANNTLSFAAAGPYPVPMRAIPTWSASLGSHFAAYNGSTVTALSTMGAGQMSLTTWHINLGTATANVTAGGWAVWLIFAAGTINAGWMQFSAEL